MPCLHRDLILTLLPTGLLIFEYLLKTHTNNDLVQKANLTFLENRSKLHKVTSVLNIKALSHQALFIKIFEFQSKFNLVYLKERKAILQSVSTLYPSGPWGVTVLGDGTIMMEPSC